MARISHPFVEPVEGTEALAVVKRVVPEVHRPHPTRLRRHFERLPNLWREPLFRAAQEVEPHVPVDPQNALVVPEGAPLTHPVEAFPETPTAVPGGPLVKLFEDPGVALAPVRHFAIPRGAADPQDPARPGGGKGPFSHQPVDCLAALDRLQSFFSISSFSAWY